MRRKYVLDPHVDEGETKWSAFVICVTGKLERIVGLSRPIYATKKEALAECRRLRDADKASGGDSVMEALADVMNKPRK